MHQLKKVKLHLHSIFPSIQFYGCMARGGHGHPKISPGPAMPYPSMPCGRTTSETALQRGLPVGRWPAAFFYPSGHPGPYVYTINSKALLVCFSSADIHTASILYICFVYTSPLHRNCAKHISRQVIPSSFIIGVL
jgi:hypothetical protein